DLTQIDLTIAELDGKKVEWNLARDIADNVLDGNPHADRNGNKDAWQFAKGKDRQGPGETFPIPPGSVLARWRDAAPASDQRTKLADELQRLLTGNVPTAKNHPDTILYEALIALDSPLLRAFDPNEQLKQSKTESARRAPFDRFGIEPSRFGGK